MNLSVARPRLGQGPQNADGFSGRAGVYEHQARAAAQFVVRRLFPQEAQQLTDQLQGLALALQVVDELKARLNTILLRVLSPLTVYRCAVVLNRLFGSSATTGKPSQHAIDARLGWVDGS